MFLKFWIISTIICIVLYGSSVLSISLEMKKKFSKEEIKKYNQRDKKGDYAWYAYVLLFVCPIVNILFVIVIGFSFGEIKEKIFKEVRKANGKQTVSDAVSEALENALKK